VPVDVVVRTAEGVPVQGARVLPADRVYLNQSDEDTSPRYLTDARGRVHFEWNAPTGGGAIYDTAITADVVREGVGRVQASAPIRIASVRWAAAVAAEDGIFPEATGGRIWARVVAADGHPAPAGVPVTLAGPRVPGAPLHAATDADGVATFDVPALGP